jgi:hypothetical protein
MQSRTLAILALSAAIVGGAAVIATGKRDEAPAADPAGKLVFPNLPARIDGVARIEIERNGEKFALARDAAGNWTMPAKAGYPADFQQVRRLALDLANMRILEARTASKALHAEIDLDGSGKDQKAVRVALFGPQGEDYAGVFVGRTRFGRQGNAGDGTFVRRTGEDQVWFVQGRVGVEREQAKWLEKRILDVARERVARAVVVTADGERLEVSRAKPDQQDFDLASVPADKKVKSAFDVNLVASAIEALDLEDVRKADGLAFVPQRDFAEFATFDGLAVRVEFARDGADVWARFTARHALPDAPVEGEKLKKPDEVAAEAAQVDKRVHGWAYRLPAYKAEQLSRKIADLVEDKGA